MKYFIRYSFFLIACLFSLEKMSYGVIDIEKEARERNTSALHLAKNLVDNIINTDNKLDYAVYNVILKDHSLSSHKGDKSYFMTDDPAAIRAMIKFVIGNADGFNVYSEKGRNRLNIWKRITQSQSKMLFGTDNIGFDAKYNAVRDEVVLCFDITGIEDLSDSTRGAGALITAFIRR
jgi:hypothetical protein